MKSQSYKLKPELNDGLIKYGEDNNLSPSFIINDLVETFLIDKGYLGIKIPVENIKVAPEKIKYAYFEEKGKRYRIKKGFGSKVLCYASVTQGARLTKELIQFLESKNWDIKYSTKSTGLTGVDQINFLLSEMEKEGFDYD